MQRVWQYLRRFNKDEREIQDFEFVPQRTEGSPMECLKVLLRLVKMFFRDLLIYRSLLLFYVMRTVGKKKKTFYDLFAAMVSARVLVSRLHLLR